MPAEDLGEYDVQPVEGNPFGAMADSPQNYDVAPVAHDPFAGARSAERLPPVNDAPGTMMENYAKHWEHVPIDWLEQLKGNELRGDTTELANDIQANGINNPLIIQAGKNSRTAKLGEGNHRLDALRSLGYTHAPARVIIGREYGAPEGVNVDSDLIPRPGEYFSQDARPSLVFRSLASPPSAAAGPGFGPQLVTPYPGGEPRTPGITHEEISLRRMREQGEWRGGRVGYYAGGGPVQLNAELRRRLALVTRPRRADGGVTDLGSADDLNLARDDPFAESGVGAPAPEAEPQPDLTEAARAGKLGTISSYTPSWSEQLKYGAQEGLKAAGASRSFAEDVGQNVTDIAGYTPGVGNVLSGNEAYRSYESGHPYLAALHAAAAIPIPGVKGVGKVAENVAENVAEKAAVPSAVRVARQLRGQRAQPQEMSVFAPEGLPESGIGVPAPPSSLGGWAKAGDPEVVWNPERRGWDLTGRKIEKGFEPTTLFDRPGTDVPPVPQSTLPRYEPPRGVPQRTVDITSDPAVREQHLALIRRGMDMGALAWYNAEPIRQRFLSELGDNEGQASFQNFMDMVASTSPQQKVPENIRAASYYYWLNQNKLPVPERGTLPKIAYGGGQPVESPYGGLSLWQMNVNRVMNEGGLNPLENPKPPSFSQNLQGNWAPATVDMHAVLAPAILARHPDWLTKEGKTLLKSGTSMNELAGNPKWWDSAPGQNEYPTLERYYQSLAQELGITPAQAQAASWVGAGHITGLGSDGNKIFNNFFEDRIANTAAKTGKPPQEVLSNFIRGRHPLLSVAPLGALPFAASSQQKRTQDTDRPAQD